MSRDDVRFIFLRYLQITVNALHPGAVNTELGRYLHEGNEIVVGAIQIEALKM